MGHYFLDIQYAYSRFSHIDINFVRKYVLLIRLTKNFNTCVYGVQGDLPADRPYGGDHHSPRLHRQRSRQLLHRGVQEEVDSADSTVCPGSSDPT